MSARLGCLGVLLGLLLLLGLRLFRCVLLLIFGLFLLTFCVAHGVTPFSLILSLYFSSTVTSMPPTTLYSQQKGIMIGSDAGDATAGPAGLQA